MALTLTSASFQDGDYLSNDHVLSAAYGFGCDGGNLSPQFSWTGVPDGTKSLALTCFDPDTPTGSGFWHWVMINIPPDTTSLELGAGSADSGKLPAGTVQVRTDFGAPGYGGPCPPEGDHPHRYIFTLSAVSLDEIPDVSAAVVGFFLNFNTIEKASLMGLYKR
ncbi:YbhB/YbcL family Raf kinase inhibitor-like protein [Candidatus Entotheonella serta]|nr:YbhB/YbcL family Raf kinase inhibitor-like protein [Candidatus Entotheonella serta]